MSNGRVVFTTKGDNRVWAFDPVAMTLTIIYDDDVQVNGVLSGVDNVGTTKAGVVYVAEDGGNMQIVLVRDDGATYPVVELPDISGSEMTGPAFDPSGTPALLQFATQPGSHLRGHGFVEHVHEARVLRRDVARGHAVTVAAAASVRAVNPAANSACGRPAEAEPEVAIVDFEPVAGADIRAVLGEQDLVEPSRVDLRRRGGTAPGRRRHRAVRSTRRHPGPPSSPARREPGPGVVEDRRQDPLAIGEDVSGDRFVERRAADHHLFLRGQEGLGQRPRRGTPPSRHAGPATRTPSTSTRR